MTRARLALFFTKRLSDVPAICGKKRPEPQAGTFLLSSCTSRWSCLCETKHPI
ncbi:hypothetical protein PGT21_013791 [Puccinia graminis f. sp. tritici]|uniref:Uncharacterized protein n=1 Tax=Puccinia graminis f. sp. tritici TaxID=56615 RepID=A0A5B0SDA3_PUCGR|nr:hypothetical protein PGTUg99_030181 [Puccinia graminis f. sp. tritici]KAA1085645.1 hypothetical protein PGT21_013791 [Puccinia graminis f. sp. tritici]KAA1136056.1 hypothetical protein PGTUg99_025360 [Puccinia graminis f. sp. tritici]